MNRTRASSLDAFGLRDQRNRIYPALEASDGSTLSIDFTQMSSLDSSLFTFTRGSTGTYINSQGYVASQGNNVPRFTYDPVTLAPLGLLMEASTSNLLCWSETFGTSGATRNWAFTGSPTLVSTATSPRNDATALRMTSASGSAHVLQNITTSATRTFSIWVRRVSGTGTINYTLTGTPGWTAFTITNTWTRYSWSGTINHVGIQITTNGDSIEIWGAQVEAGTGATSYIPTTTASLNRVADQLTMSDISALGYSTTAGTLYYNGQFTQSNTASYPVRIGFMTAVDQPTWEVFTNTSRLFAAARGTGAAPEVNLTFTLNTQSRFAASFDASLSTAEVKINLNGSTSSSSTSSLSATFTPTRLVIGRPGYEDYFPSGTIAQIKYWPVTKNATELNLLTTT